MEVKIFFNLNICKGHPVLIQMDFFPGPSAPSWPDGVLGHGVLPQVEDVERRVHGLHVEVDAGRAAQLAVHHHQPLVVATLVEDLSIKGFVCTM